MIHQLSVAVFCRGSREMRSTVNKTLRVEVGRGDEPSKSDTRIDHPMVMLPNAMVAAASKHHTIHDCRYTIQDRPSAFLVEGVLELSDEVMDTGGNGEQASGAGRGEG
jgi:hypothetical protein